MQSQLTPSPPRSAARRALVLALKILLTAVVLFFVGRQVQAHWDQIRAFDWQIDLTYLVGSILLAQLGLIIFSYGWKVIMKGLGYDLSTQTSYRVFNLASLGRYVPGKIWQMLGMLYMLKQEGVKAEHAATSFVLMQVYSIAASLMVYAVALQFEPSLLSEKLLTSSRDLVYLAGAAVLTVCLTLVVYPRPFLTLVNVLLRRLKRPVIAVQFDKRVALHSFVAYFLGWITFGLAFWLFLKSVAGDAAPSPIAAVGVYNISYQIGYLVVFAPGGFGPRELIMGLLLGPYVGSLGPALAVAARLWSVVVEAVAALAALCMKKQV